MWSKLDDDLHDNPKSLELSEAAGWLAVRMWSYSGRHGTDAHIGVKVMRSLWHSPGALEELIEQGWVHERGREADQCSHTPPCSSHLPPAITDGWVIHDYLDRNPTQAETAVQRQKTKERKSSRLRTLIFERDQHRCRYCNRVVSRSDHTSDRGFEMDHVHPEIPMGAGGVVTACKRCNSTKKDRTPTDAGMTLLPPPGELPEGIDDPWLHLDELDPNRQPNTEPGSEPAQEGVLPGSGTGTGRVESGRVGRPFQRDLTEDNPFLRSGSLPLHSDAAFAGPAPPTEADPDPPPAPPPQPQPPPHTRPARPAKPARRSKQPRNRKGRRRR